MSNLLRKQLGPKKEVMNLNLTDYTFKDEIVERELPSILFCKKHDGYTPIVFKSGPSWIGRVIRWIAVEALGLVHTVDTDGHKVELSVIDYLKAVWGEKGYDGLPNALKQTLLNKIGITVSITPIEPDQDTRGLINKLKAKSMLYDQNIENTRSLGDSTETRKWSEKAIEKLPWVLAGMGLWPLLQAIGILKG